MAVGKGKRYTLYTAEPFIETFCHALVASGVVGPACKQAGISRKTAYNWRNKWATFAQRWDDALDEFTEGLELETAWRARSRDRPAASSDAMLRFMLKANKPEKYGDRQRVEVDSNDIHVIVEYVREDPVTRATPATSESEGDGEAV